jgi:toxin CcdB
MTPATAVARRAAMRTLTPVLEVDGKEYVLMIPQLAGIAARELGPPVADLSSQRPAVLAAVDLLFTGI